MLLSETRVLAVCIPIAGRVKAKRIRKITETVCEENGVQIELRTGKAQNINSTHHRRAKPIGSEFDCMTFNAVGTTYVTNAISVV